LRGEFVQRRNEVFGGHVSEGGCSCKDEQGCGDIESDMFDAVS
jgi:hypothetical protein